MNILILHRMPFPIMRYDEAIDHDRHDVTYIGKAESLSDIPASLPCRRVERPGEKAVFEEVLAALDGVRSFDRVVSVAEFELMDAALLRRKWGLPGTSAESVELVRDKVAMKTAVARRGIRVPRFQPLSNRMPSECAWDGATILKPRGGAGSVNVLQFDSPPAVQAALATRATGIPELDCEQPRFDQYEIEEFVNGPVLHIDGVVAGGQTRVAIGNVYIGTCLGFVHGHPFGSAQIATDHELLRWSEEVVRAVGIDRGLFHLELILSDDGPCFLEIGNRFGGGHCVEAFELRTGVYQPTEDVRLQVDASYMGPIAKPSEESFYGHFVYPGHLLGESEWIIDGAERFAHHPYIVQWNTLPPDKQAAPQIQWHDLPLSGIVGGPTPNAVYTFIEELLRDVKIVTANHRPATPTQTDAHEYSFTTASTSATRG